MNVTRREMKLFEVVLNLTSTMNQTLGVIRNLAMAPDKDSEEWRTRVAKGIEGADSALSDALGAMREYVQEASKSE